MFDNGINDLMSILFLSSNPIAIKLVQNHSANIDEYHKRCKADKSFKTKPIEKDVYDKIRDIFSKLEVGLLTKFKNNNMRGFYPKNNLALGLKDSIKGEWYGSSDDPDYGWFVVTINDPRCRVKNDIKNDKGTLTIKIYAGQVESFDDYVLGMTYELTNDITNQTIKRYLYIKNEIINGKKVVKLLGTGNEIVGADKSKTTSIEGVEEPDSEWDTWYRRDKKSNNITQSWKDRKNTEISSSHQKKQSSNVDPQIDIWDDSSSKE